MQLDGNAGDMNLLYPLIVAISKDAVARFILQPFSLITFSFQRVSLSIADTIFS